MQIVLTLTLMAVSAWFGYTYAKGQIIVNKRANKAERKLMLEEAQKVNEEVLERQEEWEKAMKETMEEFNRLMGNDLGDSNIMEE